MKTTYLLGLALLIVTWNGESRADAVKKILYGSVALQNRCGVAPLAVTVYGDGKQEQVSLSNNLMNQIFNGDLVVIESTCERTYRLAASNGQDTASLITSIPKAPPPGKACAAKSGLPIYNTTIVIYRAKANAKEVYQGNLGEVSK